MTITANPPVELPLENLTPQQKWAVVQHLWTELIENYEDSIEPPAWHENVLQERAAKIARGEAVYHDLDDAIAIVKARCK